MCASMGIQTGIVEIIITRIVHAFVIFPPETLGIMGGRRKEKIHKMDNQAGRSPPGYPFLRYLFPYAVCKEVINLTK